VTAVAGQWIAPPMDYRGGTSTLVLLVGAALVALVVAATVNLEHHFRGHTNAFDHFEVALVPTLYFLPPAHAVAVAGVAKLVVQVHRRVQPTRAAFNVVQWCAAAAAGALVLAATRDP
jgi:hypothetical protein